MARGPDAPLAWRLAMGGATGWVPPLPDDPGERRRIGPSLVILAVIALLALILSVVGG